MQVEIKRLDNSLPLPEYKTDGAVGVDLYLRENWVVPPHQAVALPMNVIIKIPAGYMLAVLPRSSLIKKYGLISPHGFGVIDQDYHGPEDEIKLLVYNVTDQPINLQKGERLGQAVFVKIEKVEWQEIFDDLRSESRGGFGSTG